MVLVTKKADLGIPCTILHHQSFRPGVPYRLLNIICWIDDFSSLLNGFGAAKIQKISIHTQKAHKKDTKKFIVTKNNDKLLIYNLKNFQKKVNSIKNNTIFA